MGAAGDGVAWAGVGSGSGGGLLTDEAVSPPPWWPSISTDVLLAPYAGAVAVLLLSFVAALCTCACAGRLRRKLCGGDGSELDGFTDLPRDSLAGTGNTTTNGSVCCSTAVAQSGGTPVMLAVSPYSARIHNGLESSSAAAGAGPVTRPRSPGTLSAGGRRGILGRRGETAIARFTPGVAGNNEHTTALPLRSPRGLEREERENFSDESGSSCSSSEGGFGTSRRVGGQPQQRRLSPRQLRSIGLADGTPSAARPGSSRGGTGSPGRTPWLGAEWRQSAISGYI